MRIPTARRWSRTPRAPGRFRGGLGLRKDYLFDRPTTYTILADRDRFGPWGAFGGHDAGVAEYVLIRGGDETRLGSKVTVELEPGRRDQRADVRRRRLRPARGARPRARSLRDVREGKVCAERARDDLPRRDRATAHRPPRATEELARMSVRLAVDIGGTFTDATLIDEETGRVAIAKVLSTPADPSEGFMHAVERALAEGEADARAGQLRLPRDDRRDERDHRGQDRAQRLRHDRRLPRPARDRAPGAADALRHAVREAGAARPARPRGRRRRAARPDGRGADRRSTTARCATRPRCCGARSVESVAVCLLHSYVNPAHEQRVGAILAEELPGRAGLALGRGRARVPRVPSRVDDRDQRRDPAGRRPLPRADRGPARRRRDRGEAARDAVERRRLQLRGGAAAAGVHGRVRARPRA